MATSGCASVHRPLASRHDDIFGVATYLTVASTSSVAVDQERLAMARARGSEQDVGNDN
jgi:hypothetical protein